MRQKIAATLPLSLSAGFKLTIIFILLFISNLSFTQVRIKEKVTIGTKNYPYIINEIPTNIEPISFPEVACGSITTSLDGMYDDNILIPRWGGTLAISFDSRRGRAGDSYASGEGDKLMVFDMSGSIVASYEFESDKYDTVFAFGDSVIYPVWQKFLPVRQWELLRFRLYVKNFQYSHDTTYADATLKPNYHPLDPAFSSFITIYPPDPTPFDIASPLCLEQGKVIFYSREPLYYADSMYVTNFANVYRLRYTSIDSTPAASLPPTSGPPFTGEPILLPFEGTYRLIITGGSNAHDDLKMLSPDTTTIFTDAQSHIGDTVIIGPFPAGTPLQLAMVSHTGIWNGQTTYPCFSQYGVGDWGMSFEGWTDLLFDDLGLRLEWNAGVANHLELFTSPSDVYYGDTVQLQVRAVDSEGRFVPLENTYLFTVEIRDTNNYGSLIMDGVVDTVFNVWADSGVCKGLMYAATGTIPADTLVEVPFYLTAINYTEITPSKAGRKPVRILTSLPQPDTLHNDDNMNEKKRDILLGETKYYYLKFYENSGQYEIKESPIPNASGVSGVEFSVERLPVYQGRPGENPDGERTGVYYEYRNSDGGELNRNQQIRLIGRYWNKDSTYVVKLNASINGEFKGTAIIDVKKPARLLTPGQSPTFRLSRDVFDNEINIDDTCIVYGGKYGIPPQFLKGQMLTEAGKIDMPGNEKGFAPSYRYEPFTAQFLPGWKDDPRYNGGLWIVDTNRTGHEMGTGKDVPVHQNVQDMPYPRTPKTVWNILEENSELVNVGSSKEHRVYGKRLANGKMVFPSQYKGINKKYNEYLYLSGTWASFLSTRVKDEIARALMIEHLRDDWNGGAKNIVAQTRLASSYGLLQCLYSTAVGERGYPSRNPNISPEDFNVTNTNMEYSLEYMKKLLQNGLTITVEGNGNWPNGFEYWFKNYVWWPKWNKDAKYPNIVYPHTQKFLPQSK